MIEGGTTQASAQLRNIDAGTRLHLAAGLSAADTGQVARMLGAASGQISGRLDARAEVDMTGETVDTGLKNSRGQAVVSVVQGRVRGGAALDRSAACSTAGRDRRR
jgi:AsmA family protein